MLSRQQRALSKKSSRTYAPARRALSQGTNLLHAIHTFVRADVRRSRRQSTIALSGGAAIVVSLRALDDSNRIATIDNVSSTTSGANRPTVSCECVVNMPNILTAITTLTTVTTI